MTQTNNEREALIARLHKQLSILSAHKDFNETQTIIDLIDAIKFIEEAPISQNEQQEEVAPYGVKLSVIGVKRGFEVDRGTFKTMDEAKAYAHREHGDRDDVVCEYLELYTSPPKQAIPEGWISTKDRLPDQLELKIKLIDGSEIYAWYQSDGDYYWNCGGREIFIDESKVTHWMPLPEAPTTSLTSETNTEVGE